MFDEIIGPIIAKIWEAVGDKIITIITTSSIWLLIFLYIGIKIAKDPYIIQTWIKFISGIFAGISHKAEKVRVSARVHEGIDKFASELLNQSSDIIPYTLRIKWVPIPNAVAYLQNNKIIVKMNYHTNEQSNLVTATMAYVEQGVIPHAKRHLAPPISRAVDLSTTKKILTLHDDLGAIECFFREVVEPEIKDPILQEYFTVMDQLDEKGFFTRILLREFVLLGRRLLTSFPKKEIASESIKFLEFLKRVVEKEHGEDVDPTFTGSIIKMTLVFIARKETISQQGYHPYISWIEKCCKESITSIYIAGTGNNIDAVKGISRVCEKKGLINIESSHIFKIKHKKGELSSIMVIAKSILH